MELGSISIKLSEFRVLCLRAIEQVGARPGNDYQFAIENCPFSSSLCDSLPEGTGVFHGVGSWNLMVIQ